MQTKKPELTLQGISSLYIHRKLNKRGTGKSVRSDVKIVSHQCKRWNVLFSVIWITISEGREDEKILATLMGVQALHTFSAS